MNSTEIINSLYQIYNALNEHYWNNELPEVFITLKQGRTKTKSVLGTFYADSYAKQEYHTNQETGEAIPEVTETKHEISMGAEFIARPLDQIAATMQHEMCHLYAQINNIQDTSRNNQFHNKKFKKLGETHGLILTCDEKNGWTYTEPSPEFSEYINVCNIDTKPFQYYRQTILAASKPAPKKRWICPICSQEAQAKKTASLACGEHLVKMDYWDMTDPECPEILQDNNEGLAMSADGWYLEYMQRVLGEGKEDDDTD